MKTEIASRRIHRSFPADLPALTSVRLWLALGVVLFHYQLQWPWNSLEVTGLLNRARLGVDVFFILSGFVLTHAYRDVLTEGRLDYRQFMLARFARIYPAHLAVLTFVVAMVVTAGLLGADYDHQIYNIAGLVATLALVHAWFPAVGYAEWNGPSWSLSAEWFAYLAFPAFAWLGLVLRLRPLLLLALSGGAFLGLDLLYRLWFGDMVVHAETRLGILRIIPEFLYGIALYRLGERLNPSPRTAMLLAPSTGLILLALMHAAADDRLIVVAAGPLVLSLALLAKCGLGRAFGSPWMLLGGEASYALYLVHMPLLIGWKGVHSALTGRPSNYIFDWWEIPALLALTLVSAVALHYLIETPARRWIRRQGDRLWPGARSSRMTTGSQPPDV